MNLEDAKDRATLSNAIAREVEAECVRHFDEGHRRHLGVSIIGRECKRELWSSFRWLHKEKFSGRMLRLFNRGHREEPAIIERLKAIGFRVEEVDPETGKQWRVVNCEGHYGGSCDAKAYPPAFLGINEPLLAEFKTYNDRRFKELKSKGLAIANPDHMAQMSSYGAGLGIRYGLYCAVNKNTDEYHFEVVKLDMRLADIKLALANEIIFSQLPLPKISERATDYRCKDCHFAGICHLGDAPEKNCRSCDNAFPAKDKRWYCRVHDDLIPDEVIPVGCDSWRRIV